MSVKLQALHHLLTRLGITNFDQFISTYTIGRVNTSLTPEQSLQTTLEPLQTVCLDDAQGKAESSATLPISEAVEEPASAEAVEEPASAEAVEKESSAMEQQLLVKRANSIESGLALDQTPKYACCAYLSSMKVIISVFRTLLNLIFIDLRSELCSEYNFNLLRTKYNITHQVVVDFLNWFMTVDIIITLLRGDCSKERIKEFTEGMIEIYCTTQYYLSKQQEKQQQGNEYQFNEDIKKCCAFYFGLILFIFYLTWTKYKSLDCLNLKTRKFDLTSASQYKLLLELFTFTDIYTLTSYFPCPGLKSDIEEFLRLIKICSSPQIVCCPFHITYDSDKIKYVIIFFDFLTRNTITQDIDIGDVLHIVSYCANTGLSTSTYVEFATELKNFNFFSGLDPSKGRVVHSVNIKSFNIETGEAIVGNNWGTVLANVNINLNQVLSSILSKGPTEYLELNGVFVINKQYIPPIYLHLVGNPSPKQIQTIETTQQPQAVKEILLLIAEQQRLEQQLLEAEQILIQKIEKKEKKKKKENKQLPSNPIPIGRTTPSKPGKNGKTGRSKGGGSKSKKRRKRRTIKRRKRKTIKRRTKRRN